MGTSRLRISERYKPPVSRSTHMLSNSAPNVGSQGNPGSFNIRRRCAIPINWKHTVNLSLSSVVNSTTTSQVIFTIGNITCFGTVTTHRTGGGSDSTSYEENELVGYPRTALKNRKDIDPITDLEDVEYYAESPMGLRHVEAPCWTCCLRGHPPGEELISKTFLTMNYFSDSFGSFPLKYDIWGEYDVTTERTCENDDANCDACGARGFPQDPTTGTWYHFGELEFRMVKLNDPADPSAGVSPSFADAPFPIFVEVAGWVEGEDDTVFFPIEKNYHQIDNWKTLIEGFETVGSFVNTTQSGRTITFSYNIKTEPTEVVSGVTGW